MKTSSSAWRGLNGRGNKRRVTLIELAPRFWTTLSRNSATARFLEPVGRLKTCPGSRSPTTRRPRRPDVGVDRGGQTRFRTAVIDANNVRLEQYSDVRSQIVTV